MEDIKLPYKTNIDIVKPEKTEQKPLVQEKEPDTTIIDMSSSISYLSLYSEEYSSVSDLIDTYRSMVGNFEVSECVDEILNDAVVVEDDESIEINTDRVELSDNIKKKIDEEFKNVLSILNWNDIGDDLFRKWFVEGRLYQQKVMFSNPKLGIERVVTLDPKKIQRLKKKDTSDIYYQYKLNDKETYMIPNDGIVFTPSGILDASQSFYISELHDSIRPLNNMRLMEDSALIYYITRAPQKRAFYIDVGNTPTGKATEKVKKIMQQFKQRISYDSTTGKIIQQKNTIPVNEDFYFATRGDTRGTKVDTLEGNTNLLDVEFLGYFKKKLYKSLSVPYGRMDDENNSTIDFSNNSEMSRQELKMFKQTNKRRKRFSPMFDNLLKTQLISKSIITQNEWKIVKAGIYYKWKNDTYITMIKQQEILSKQIEIIDGMTEYIGKYFSHDYIRKEILKQTTEDIELIDKQIEEEKNDSRYVVDNEDEM